MITDTFLFRRIELQLLINLTARAFGKPAKRIWTLPHDEALRVYAEYTREHLQEHAGSELLQRMNEEAIRMGLFLRKVFRLKKAEDIERFTFGLYRNIGIEMEGDIPGHLCVKRCFFSRYYTPEVCLAASALDDGIIKGLSGGGELVFQQRITEGCKHCLATFSKGDTTIYNK